MKTVMMVKYIMIIMNYVMMMILIKKTMLFVKMKIVMKKMIITMSMMNVKMESAADDSFSGIILRCCQYVYVFFFCLSYDAVRTVSYQN
jgi:hypothetical protein